jgi:hypothetical protein
LGWKAAAVKIPKSADMTGLKPADIPEKFFHLDLWPGPIRVILLGCNFQIGYTYPRMSAWRCR